MAKLIKIDRNGSKHYEGMIECDRCQGRGLYAIGMCNGQLVITTVDNGVCHKCGGSGKVHGKWIERTPEYQAKLDARRAAKAEAARIKWEAEEAEREAERKAAEAKKEAERAAKEAEIKAQKAISQYVGEEKQMITTEAIYDHSAWYEVRDMFGRPETRYIHTFRDLNGNVFVWKTGCGLPEKMEEGTKIELTGTVKEHNEYKDEKQTVLLRVKVKMA